LPFAVANPVTEALIVSSGLARIATEVTGAGPAVVFLHAGVADRRMWQPQLAATGAPPRYRAVAYDRRGFGETLHAEERYSQVGDLFRVLDAVAPREPAILVGCSQGGRIAIDAALADPARVRALVLIAPAISGAPEVTPVPPAIQAWIDDVENAEAAADIDRINVLEAHAWLDGPLAQEGRVGGAVRELFLAMNDIALRAERRGTEIEPEPAYRRVREIAVPTLLVWGDLDFPQIAQRCRYLAVEMPRVTTHPMQDTAHLPGLEHPAQFDRALRAFLESLARS
jgi:pimeloyl-ACP methyl ester carboxylesterase